jgi:hypothetical protein
MAEKAIFDFFFSHINDIRTGKRLIDGDQTGELSKSYATINPDQLAAEVLFTYSEHGCMVEDLYVAAFDISVRKVVEQVIHCSITECDPGRTFTLGYPTVIKDVINSKRDVWSHLATVDAVRGILQEVVDTRPDVIGRPLSIIEYTPPGGPKWIEKGKCGDSN